MAGSRTKLWFAVAVIDYGNEVYWDGAKDTDAVLRTCDIDTVCGSGQVAGV